MNPWAAIVGGRDEGRDAALRLVVDELEKRGLSVGGHIQEQILAPGDDDRVEGYDLIDLITGERISLARASRDPTLCDLAFDEGAFAKGRDWLDNRKTDVVVLTVGKLEMGEKGHWPSIHSALEGRNCMVILMVRRRVFAPIVLKLPDPIAALDLPTNPDEVSTFADLIEQARTAD